MQQWIERIAWVLITGLLLWLWNAADRDTSDMTQLLQEQNERMERQTAQLDSLSTLLQPTADTASLELKRDLISKPHLITVPGVLGGTMRIFSEDHIRILDDSWVYAQFEDGHIQAGGLFSYKRERDGRITWTLLESKVF